MDESFARDLDIKLIPTSDTQNVLVLDGHSINCSHYITEVAMLGNSALVNALLEAGADPNVRDMILKLTVTHDAAREGFLETVRVLVDRGADVNLADENGNLPLHLAAKEGHLEVVKLLLELTEDPQKTNDLGHSALKLARDAKHEETADFIEQCLGSYLKPSQ
ncbi:cyclin-dependent kinase 4 inhibitor C isoform X3 [Girardinichthys multiradiatus]|uniref:cyclin-dependent kinase 4 inhibitor C isoform X3 n=1 Tax=Girardinichthys multiradiatus TaxID=208333 RepID=UPI001FAD6D64|nr:cyclin-dependent kinase 4 inhibitor C isoform X3 [Girardinichthys multiradiatus]